MKTLRAIAAGLMVPFLATAPAMAASDAVNRQNLAASGAMAAAPAVAAGPFGTMLLAATRVGNFSSTTVNTLTAVPLDDAQHTLLHFTTTTANQKIVIFYNAECGVAAAAGTWVGVEVLIGPSPVQANPASGTTFAMCTAVSTSVFPWAGAMRMSTFTVKTAGSHYIQVMATGSGTGSWWLGDSSLVILNAGS